MVKVYFENSNGSYSELVATFEDEKVYIACLPLLEKQAIENGFDKVTESIETEDEKENIDLFQDQEKLPIEMQKLLEKFEEKDTSYHNCEKLLKKCLNIGYAFDYGLDAIPFNLKKI